MSDSPCMSTIKEMSWNPQIRWPTSFHLMKSRHFTRNAISHITAHKIWQSQEWKTCHQEVKLFVWPEKILSDKDTRHLCSSETWSAAKMPQNPAWRFHHVNWFWEQTKESHTLWCKLKTGKIECGVGGGGSAGAYNTLPNFALGYLLPRNECFDALVLTFSLWCRQKVVTEDHLCYNFSV